MEDQSYIGKAILIGFALFPIIYAIAVKIQNRKNS